MEIECFVGDEEWCAAFAALRDLKGMVTVCRLHKTNFMWNCEHVQGYSCQHWFQNHDETVWRM